MLRKAIRTALPGTAKMRVEKFAHLMDEAFRVPFTDFRFGLDPLLTFLPFSGNIMSLVLNMYIVLEGFVAEAPWYILLAMTGITAIDFLLGFIPYIGPLIDAVFKSNTWNRKLLQKYLD